MTTRETEATVLEGLAEEFKARGYDVYLQPHKLGIPKFFGKFVPDLVAFRTDINPGAKNIAVELVRPGRPRRHDGESVAELFENQPDWDYHIVRLAAEPPRIPPPSEAEIEARIDDVSRLVSESRLGPALLLGWAVLEAVGRSLLADVLQRPQVATGLVEALAMAGHLMPEESDFLLELASKRNALAHGDLQVAVERAELDRLLAIMASLRGLVPA